MAKKFLKVQTRKAVGTALLNNWHNQQEHMYGIVSISFRVKTNGQKMAV